jgi:hypothetical protein
MGGLLVVILSMWLASKGASLVMKYPRYVERTVEWGMF